MFCVSAYKGSIAKGHLVNDLKKEKKEKPYKVYNDTTVDSCPNISDKRNLFWGMFQNIKHDYKQIESIVCLTFKKSIVGKLSQCKMNKTLFTMRL